MNLGKAFESLRGQLNGLSGRLPGRGGSGGSGAAAGAAAEGAGNPAMPRFLGDAVTDLREQGLLPVVVILLVAIPLSAIVFSATGGSYSPPASASAATSGQDDDGSLVVVADRPGLREHGDRFAERTPRDPFASVGGPGPFGVPEGPALPGAGGSDPKSPDTVDGGGSGTDGFGSTTADQPAIGGFGSTGGSFGGSSGGGSSSGSTGNSGSSVTTITDVKIETEYVHTHAQAKIRFGEAGSGELHDVGNLPRLRGLPLNHPVVFYLGSSVERGAALFSLSPDIVAINGKGRCLSGNTLRCYYLLLRPGDAVNIFDGLRMRTWRLALSGIEVIEREVDVIDEVISGSTGKRGAGPAGPARGRDRAVSREAE